MVRSELASWLSGILQRHANTISKQKDGIAAIKEVLSGFNITADQIKQAAEANYLPTGQISWNEEDFYKFSDTLMLISKPVIIAANKLDKSTPEQLAELSKKLKGYTVIGCSGAVELALRQAEKKGYITYIPGSSSFTRKGEVTQEQKQALDFMQSYLEKQGTTGVQELINKAVFDVLGNIVVYPVEDENKYTDHNGNVLPDAILVKKGATALDLAAKIHSDLAKGMLYAIDAKRKVRVGKDYVLKNNDVIKIVSTAKG